LFSRIGLGYCEVIDLGTLGGGWSTARGINNLGQVVGSAQVPSGDWQAFLWTPEAGMQDVGTVGGPNSEVRAISGKIGKGIF
jgi:probable HAF family extracellular repeat protein